MIDRVECSGGRVSLEQGEIGDPDEAVLPLGDELETPGELLPHAVERGAGHTVWSGYQETEVPIGEPEPACRAGWEVLGGAALERTTRGLEPEQAGGAQRLGHCF